VDHVREKDKVVVEELIPALMTLGEVQKVLQNLLKERVSIRDMESILETLADWAPRTKDPDQLTEQVRGALARQICQQYTNDDGVMHVLTLDPALEQHLREVVQITGNGVSLAITPMAASSLLTALRQEVQRVNEQSITPVLLCSSQIRFALRRLTERTIPSLVVLSYNEIVPKLEVQTVGTVQSNLSETAFLNAAEVAA
jgi:flagellar biosynthesis protein FlhA